MTKSEVKAALDKAMQEYNTEMESYIISCGESEKCDYRKIAATTMDCFAEFEKVIIKLAED